MTDSKGSFPPFDYGKQHRAAFVREQAPFLVGCPKCGQQTESPCAPTSKKPVKCGKCGLDLLPT